MNLLRVIRSIWPGGEVDNAPGPRGERAAADHLQRQGYRILARNYRTRLGEIDIVAQAPGEKMIVIVEVKSREGAFHSAQLRPEEHVNSQKQRKLAQLALQLVRDRKLDDRPVRFDVIGVDLTPNAEPVIRHHEAAFESPW